MRKKLFIGTMIVTILCILAGGHFFARTNAQDPPKKAEPEKKDGGLFDALKKALEEKKDAPTIPSPPPGGLSLPALPQKEAPTPVFPPLDPIKKDNAAPPPFAPLDPNKKDNAAPTFPPLPTQAPANQGTPSLPPPDGPSTVKPPLPGVRNVPDIKSLDPIPNQPPANAPIKPLVVDGPPSQQPFPPIGRAEPQTAPPTVQISPNKIADDIAKVKDCPWSMNIEMVNGQTVVTATVNKRHEFKIVCQTLDLQTGKGTLKASGKVQITGDMMTGSCEHLAIPLHEDCLILDGAAEVRIEKMSATVSDTKPAMFEMKGAALHLRISDFAPKVLQTSMRKDAVEALPGNRATMNTPAESKQWTQYGTLKRTYRKREDGPALWNLTDRAGKVLAVLIARDGGSLSQWEGQSISVFGAREDVHGESVLRVTHVALP
jgi:hypothetical protein